MAKKSKRRKEKDRDEKRKKIKKKGRKRPVKRVDLMNFMTWYTDRQEMRGPEELTFCDKLKAWVSSFPVSVGLRLLSYPCIYLVGARRSCRLVMGTGCIFYDGDSDNRRVWRCHSTRSIWETIQRLSYYLAWQLSLLY